MNSTILLILTVSPIGLAGCFTCFSLMRLLDVFRRAERHSEACAITMKDVFQYRRFRQGLQAFAIGYAISLVGAGSVAAGGFIGGMLGSILLVVGYQVMFWAIGIRTELLGNATRKEPENGSGGSEQSGGAYFSPAADSKSAHP